MNILKAFFITTTLILYFNGCSSKTQTDIIDSNKKDISDLLRTLIEKEKEINNLKLSLEKCQEKTKIE